MTTIRKSIRVTGVVQGVGFRPFAWRLAQELGCTGAVYNDPSGVLIEVQGSEEDGIAGATHNGIAVDQESHQWTSADHWDYNDRKNI